MEDLLLLQFVREVSILADTEHPEAVTQRAWDAARAKLGSSSVPSRVVAGAASSLLSDVPSSSRLIARSLDRSWPVVLEIAHSSRETQRRRLAQQQAELEQDWLTRDHIAYVLRVVARRLGVRTLSQSQYSAERKRVFSESRTRKSRGARLRLPTVAQIRAFTRAELYASNKRGTPTAGSWSRALEIAGLRPGSTPKLKTAAKTPIDLLDRCYDAYGVQATSQEARDFAKANGIPYTRGSGKPWREWVKEWKAGRRRQGLPVPDRPPPRRLKPDYTRNIGAARPDEHRQGSWTDPNDCIAVLVRYLSQLPKGQHATMNGYAAWAKEQPRAPDPTGLKRHGGWLKMIQLARKQMLAEIATQRPPTQRARRPKTSCPSERPTARLSPAQIAKLGSRSSRP